ncbi:MAG TPA: hypothetical protein VMA72_16930 [Streptosporangiaceae bacterium]|nr:hypothetical protein [Streptosporangiaceae bacterium]
MSEQQPGGPSSEPASSGPAPSEPAPRDSAGPPGTAGLSGGAVPLPSSDATTSSAAPLPSFDAAGLLALVWAEVDELVELSPAEIAALPVASDGPPDLDDVPWWLSNEYFGSDEAEQAAWLRGLPADVAAAWRDEPRSDDLPGAGFTHHDAGVGLRPEAGFAAGGVLDAAAPGPVLAAAVAAAATRGSGLGESELIGVLCGWQRLASWAQAG